MKQLIDHFWFQVRRILKMFSTPSVTIQYPFISRQIANLARSQLRLEIGDCTACMDCEKLCPVQAIKVFPTAPSEGFDHGNRFSVQQITVDYGVCTFCGVCVDICEPTALQYQKLEIPVNLNRGDLVVKLVQNKSLPETIKRY